MRVNEAFMKLRDVSPVEWGSAKAIGCEARRETSPLLVEKNA